MYTINVDLMNKIVIIETVGIMLKEEIISFVNEIDVILSQYGSKEVTILMLLDRMDPVAQEYLPLLINSLIAQADHIIKLVNVHKKVVTRLQAQRIQNEADKSIGCTFEVIKFNNRIDALEYLYGKGQARYKPSNSV